MEKKHFEEENNVYVGVAKELGIFKKVENSEEAQHLIKEAMLKTAYASPQGLAINPYDSINVLVKKVHEDNCARGWWTDLKREKQISTLRERGFDEATIKNIFEAMGLPYEGKAVRDMGNLLALVHSEVSEALEGDRKNLMDDKLPHRPMTEVELADTVIRIMDICGAFGFDLGGAIKEKLEYNAQREDHKIENRLKENGKKY